MNNRSANSVGWFKHVEIKSEIELLEYQKHLPKRSGSGQWLFRGTPKSYPLKTSLERHLDDAGVPAADRPERECQLLKEFKRRAHHYLHLLPCDGDTMGWLALMQHYGAPTRLLDWTYSFYIAAYFALSDASSIDAKPCFVWALCRDHFKLSSQTNLASRAHNIAFKKGLRRDDIHRADSDSIQDGINAFLRSVMNTPEKCIWAVNSFRLNERQSVQQGVFFCPGDVRCSFEDNLKRGNPSPKNVVRFELSTERKARARMLTVLNRMNISHASLFPGLSGFAQSLGPKLWVSGALRPKRSTHA